MSSFFLAFFLLSSTWPFPTFRHWLAPRGCQTFFFSLFPPNRTGSEAEEEDVWRFSMVILIVLRSSSPSRCFEQVTVSFAICSCAKILFIDWLILTPNNLDYKRRRVIALQTIWLTWGFFNVRRNLDTGYPGSKFLPEGGVWKQCLPPQYSLRPLPETEPAIWHATNWATDANAQILLTHNISSWARFCLLYYKKEKRYGCCKGA